MLNNSVDHSLGKEVAIEFIDWTRRIFRDQIRFLKGSVGQGFADELFRVWAIAHPNIKLIPIRMNEAVEFMINRSLNNK